MAYNNQRGGYGQRSGGYSRGGNGFGGNNRGGNRGGSRGGNGPSNYLRSSTFVKNVILEGENGKREAAPLEPGVTEEIAITFTAAKVEELKAKIEDAENDPNGDGGIRITMYCQNKVNQETGEEFDGASLMIVGKFPPRNQQGGNRGGFKGRSGGGRRDYGNQQDDGGNQQSARGARRGNSSQSHADEDYSEQGNDQETATKDTQQSTRGSRGSQTQGSKKGGHTQNAQNDASHSEGYSEEPGW